MSAAVVTSIIDRRADPRHPARRDFVSYNIAFDGSGGSGLKSQPIEKIGLGVADFSWLAFTTAILMTFEVAHLREGPFVVKDGLSVDLTTLNSFSTALLAGYGYYKIVLNAAEAKAVGVGHL